MKQLKLYVRGLFMKKMTKKIVILKQGEPFLGGKLKKNAYYKISMFYEKKDGFHEFHSHRPKLRKWNGGISIPVSSRMFNEDQEMTIYDMFNEALIAYLNHQSMMLKSRSELIRGQMWIDSNKNPSHTFFNVK